MTGGGALTLAADVRAPIFYDSNDTGYYCDPNSTTRLNGLNVVGDITVGVGQTSSNIYFADTDETGRRIHCNSNRIGFLNSSNGWGSYCSNNGDWVTDTISYAGTSHRAPIFYDSNDTAYYGDFASGSRFYSLTTINRIYSNEWIQMDNFSGLYSPNNAAHFFPNSGSYGAWRVQGSRNSWGGIEFDTNAGNNVLMIHTNGQTVGIHNNSYGWKFFWEAGRMYCYDSTYGGGSQRMLLQQDTWQGSKHFGSDGAIYGTVFYDASDGTYYADLNNTGTSIRCAGNITAYYSDERLKTHLGKIENAVDKVKALEGFYYEANEIAQSLGYKAKREVGVGAQAVQKVLPEIVTEAPASAKYLTIDYAKLTPLLIEAIKEQQLQIEELKALIKK
jgi:hypothetical protein